MSLKIRLEHIDDGKQVAEVVLCSRLTDSITADGSALSVLSEFAGHVGREFGVDVFVRDEGGQLLYWWTPREVRS
jgi:hypothetical protein